MCVWKIRTKVGLGEQCTSIESRMFALHAVNPGLITPWHLIESSELARSDP